MIRFSVFAASRADSWEQNPDGSNRPADRLATSLSWAMARMPADAEFVIVDFGGESPLADALPRELSAHSKVRIVRVLPDRAKACGGGFNEPAAWNHCVRASRGEWVIKTDGDVLLGDPFWSWLRDPGPQPGHFYFSNRRFLPEGRTVPVGNEPIERDPKIPFWKDATGVLIVERERWHALRGVDESLCWRQHVEHSLICRLMKSRTLVDLGPATGTSFFHLWHRRDGHNARAHNRQLSDAELAALPEVLNGDGWGLSDLL